jgi:hypothetical protein
MEKRGLLIRRGDAQRPSGAKARIDTFEGTELTLEQAITIQSDAD